MWSALEEGIEREHAAPNPRVEAGVGVVHRDDPPRLERPDDGVEVLEADRQTAAREREEDVAAFLKRHKLLRRRRMAEVAHVHEPEAAEAEAVHRVGVRPGRL